MGNIADAPLRFAIMCPPGKLALWQTAAIEELIDGGHGQPALLIIQATNPVPSDRSDRLLRWLSKPNALWRLFKGLNTPAAMRPVELPKALIGIPQVSDEDIAAIRAHDLAFILRFASGIVKGAMLESARYGVWSLRHGDESRYRGGPPYFWEIYNGDPLAGATLQRLTQNPDAGVVLRKGWLDVLDYSYSRNYDRMLMETASWPAYAAAEIRSGAASAPSCEPAAEQAPAYRTPSNLTMLRFLFILVRNLARMIVARSLRAEWSVGIVPISIEDIARGAPVSGVNWCPPVADGWVADPMTLSRNGVVDVLCERMELASGKGHIAALRFDGRAWSKDVPALFTGCHASYPYLVEAQGQIYCVPETYEANQVTLYRALEYPHAWQKVAALLSDFPGVDSTIFRYGERWWLLSASREGPHRLYAWFATDLLGPWQPHRANPIKIDVRSSRPAGPPFWVDGEFLRPAQDCSKTYGGRVVLNRIVELSPTRFCEEAVSFVEPDVRGPYGKGLHTISPLGEQCVIDGFRWRLKTLRSLWRATRGLTGTHRTEQSAAGRAVHHVEVAHAESRQIR